MISVIHKEYALTNLHLQDLNPLNAGEEQCYPTHKFGPFIRRYTLIHYVISGSGTLTTTDGQYPVHAGEAFLILPDEVTTYAANPDDPWYYQWIGFEGRLAKDFEQLPRVFPVSADIFAGIIRAAEAAVGAEYRVTAMLFRLYGELFSATDRGNPHVRKVSGFIDINFMQPITVEMIAKRLNLDRRYLSRLFKEKTGVTIQEYLISVRLKEACEYLLQGYNVRDAASLCGYEDVSNFSRMFKRKYGLSPAYWQQNHRSAGGIEPGDGE